MAMPLAMIRSMPSNPSRSGNASGVHANDEVWAYPVYCRPDWTIAALPPSKLELWFTIDKAKWQPVMVGLGNPEIAAMLPPERIASHEGVCFIRKRRNEQSADDGS